MTAPSGLERRLLDALERADDDRFESLALDIFAYQYARNAPYRAFCDRRGLTPGHVRRWQEIPAVPTAAFKVADLTCRPEQPSAYFLTSGTTQGSERRGRHLIASLALSRAAILPNARAHLFADVDRIDILSLTPPPPFRPHSSLIHMIDVMIQEWGAAGSGYVGTADGLDADALAGALRRAEADGRPVALLGTTASFALFFDYCDMRGLAFTLPAASRLMETGGAKGMDGEAQRFVQQPAFLEACRRILNLAAHAVIHEYGMTELSSQFYAAGSAEAFQAPRWVRVRTIDPGTGDDVPAGTPGLLCHYDLANLHSVMAIQTDDIGIRSAGTDDRFQIIGRAAGAERRGCSLDPAAATLTRL